MKHLLTAAIALLSLSSCNGVAGWFGTNDSTTTNTTNTATITRDESITPENAYSDLFLDSNAVNKYITAQNMDPSMAAMMRNFYLQRNNQYAWFNSTGLTEEGRGFWSLYRSDEESKDKEDSLEQRMDSLVQKDSLSIAASDSSFANAELAMTAKLVQQVFTDNGMFTAENIYTLVPKKKMATMELADSILNKQKDSTFFARNMVYNQLRQQLSVYYNASKNGGWPTVSAIAPTKKGVGSPAVTALKKRLQATEDYDPSDTTAIMNDSLVAAIKDVQKRFGLAPTGKVNDSLITELNVTAEQRLQQIILNVNRSKWMKSTYDSTRIEVNIPAQLLYAYKGSTRVLEMPVIVGEEGTSTTMFSGKISEVVFNPSWKIPESIVRNEIVPAMKKDPGYLKKKNMERTGGTDSLPEIKQLPGKDNALGRVKFLFPNSFDIYLHDTPDKTLFTKKDRRLSHGCIRVARADELAAFVLNDWNKDKVNSAMKGEKEQSVKVNNPVAVNISYLTAWVDEKGKISFRPDNYGHDSHTMARLFTASATDNVAGKPIADSSKTVTKP